jgi:hypothetical protein
MVGDHRRHLEQNDPVRVRGVARANSREDRARIERELTSQVFPRRFERGSVRSGVADQEDDAIDAAVTLLQGDPTLNGLRIAKAGLCLDGDDVASCESNHGIPRSTIPGDWQRNLAVPRRPRGQYDAKPSQEGELRCVSDGIPIRVRTDDKLEPDGRASKGQLFDRGRAQRASLNPSELRVGHPDRRTCRRLAQARVQSTLADISSNGRPDPSSHPQGVRGWVSPIRHGPSLPARTYLPVN